MRVSFVLDTGRHDEFDIPAIPRIGEGVVHPLGIDCRVTDVIYNITLNKVTIFIEEEVEQ